MQKKLTISIDEKIYAGLHSVIGRGNISRFIEDVTRPYLFSGDLENAYRDMASDSAREAAALAWAEALVADSAHETR